MPDINALLSQMRQSGKVKDMKSKGNLGEEAVLRLCLERKEKSGTGLLYQSFSFPYQSNRSGKVYTGNIVYENEVFKEFTDSSINDEVDVLYVTPYRIFAIEVKSYGNCKIDIYDYWFNKNGEPVYKSPVCQAEKHARHLYHAIHPVIPDGVSNYIVPMVCFVDKCVIRDERCQRQQDYIPVCILNNFLKTIAYYNTPLDYNLDLEAIKDRLNRVKSSVKKTL